VGEREANTQPPSGGLEMLFSDERKHRLSVPARDGKGDAVTVGWLVDYLCDEIMKDNRKEMFVLDGHV
jgi:ubiquitin related modifier 1